MNLAIQFHTNPPLTVPVRQSSSILPRWWNTVHDRALTYLSSEWTNLADLKRRSGLHSVAFEDLLAAGVAQQNRQPLTGSNGSARGERVFYRLTQS